MSSLAGLPFIKFLSQSVSASDRTSFVRIFDDYATFLQKQCVFVPNDWLDALNACLGSAGREERSAYLEKLKPCGSLAVGRAEPSFTFLPLPQSTGESNVATHTSVDSERQLGELFPKLTSPRFNKDDIIEPSGSRDLKPPLAPPGEDVVRLVARARGALDINGDRRLADAILANNPIRLEMAPLFLEATSEQRRAIMLAAQRAELGRRHSGAFATVGRQTIAQLEHAAIAGNPERFHDLLARAVGAPLDLASRIADDPTGEPLVLALLAIGAPNDVCVRIMTAHDMHEGGGFRRVHTLARLNENATPLAARRILSAILGDQLYKKADTISKATTMSRRSRVTLGILQVDRFPPKRVLFNLGKSIRSAQNSRTS